MRRCLAFALVVALVTLGVPTMSLATAAQAGGTISGVAKDAGGAPLGDRTVRLRNTASGQIADTTKSAPNGEFAFHDVPPGTYIIEILDSSRKVIAASAPLGVSTGGSVVGVTVTGAAAPAAAAAGGIFAAPKGILLLEAFAVGVAATTTVFLIKGETSPSK